MTSSNWNVTQQCPAAIEATLTTFALAATAGLATRIPFPSIGPVLPYSVLNEARTVLSVTHELLEAKEQSWRQVPEQLRVFDFHRQTHRDLLRACIKQEEAWNNRGFLERARWVLSTHQESKELLNKANMNSDQFVTASQLLEVELREERLEQELGMTSGKKIGPQATTHIRKQPPSSSTL